MIIPLLLPVNPVYPAHIIGQAVTVANGRRGMVQKRMDSGKYRVLVDCKLTFPVPHYFTFAELQAFGNWTPMEARLAA